MYEVELFRFKFRNYYHVSEPLSLAQTKRLLYIHTYLHRIEKRHLLHLVKTIV